MILSRIDSDFLRYLFEQGFQPGDRLPRRHRRAPVVRSAGGDHPHPGVGTGGIVVVGVFCFPGDLWLAAVCTGKNFG